MEEIELVPPPIVHCASCGAEIRWVLHRTTGKKMPIDACAVENGNLRLYCGDRRTTDELGNVRVPTLATVEHSAQPDLFDETDSGVRYVAHFVTCPHAEWWRGQRPRSADTPGPRINPPSRPP